MNQNGFSLIEVIITLALVAILASLALVSYQSHFLKMKQSAARLELLMVASEIEKFFETHQTYQGVSLEKIGHKVMSEDYQIKIIRSDEFSYQLAAIPKQQYPEDECVNFYLDQDGNKSISGAGTIEECW
jgi:type IV pilus assembly protein PilE